MLNWISNYVIEKRPKTNSISKSEKKTEGSTFNNELLVQASHTHRNSDGNCDFTLPLNSVELFRRVDDLDFNCFEFYEASQKNGLVCLMYYFFDRLDLFGKLKISQKMFVNFITKIQKGSVFPSVYFSYFKIFRYLDNPYHNAIHAIDVTQTTNFILRTCQFSDLSDLSSLEIAAMYLAASIHDFEHP